MIRQRGGAPEFRHYARVFGGAVGHRMGWEKDSGVEFDHQAARGIAQLFEYGRVVVPVLFSSVVTSPIYSNW